MKNRCKSTVQLLIKFNRSKPLSSVCDMVWSGCEILQSIYTQYSDKTSNRITWREREQNKQWITKKILERFAEFNLTPLYFIRHYAGETARDSVHLELFVLRVPINHSRESWLAVENGRKLTRAFVACWDGLLFAKIKIILEKSAPSYKNTKIVLSQPPLYWACGVIVPSSHQLLAG